jgi:hypothetical protein
VTVVLWGSAVVHDNLSCLGCDAPQPATTDETLLPRRAASLGTRATMLRAQADELDAEAKRVERTHSRLRPGMWLCSAHHEVIDRYDESGRLRLAWLGGRAADNAELAQETRTFLDEHPVPTSGERGLPPHPRPRRLAPA